MSQSAQIRRTVAFAVAVVALLAVARSGASHSIVLVLFVGLVVVATVWVRGQYEVFVRREAPWELWEHHRGWAVLLVAAGVAGVVVFWRRGVDWFGLGGMLLIYFAAGSWVSSLRRNSASGGRGLRLLLVGLVVVIVSTAVMGRAGSANRVALVAVSVALLLLLPVAGAWLAESRITTLAGPADDAQSDPHRATRLLWGVGGGAGFTALTVGVGLMAGSWWAAGAIVALGLLMVALASSTQADTAVILAGIALMGTTPLQASLLVPFTAEPGDRRVLVALGDSYMSGEGASVYFDNTDNGGENSCRRSPTAWAAMAGQLKPFNGLVFLACSGANTWNVRSHAESVPSPTPQGNEPGTQLSQYAAMPKNFRPALVVLSLGGNNAGFSTIGLMCLAPGNCNDKKDLWMQGLPQVETALQGAYDDVRFTFSRTPVVVIPYPDPIDATNAEGCDEVALSPGEIDFISQFLRGLNEAVKRAADQHGFYYLAEMESSLSASHLRLCDERNDGRPGLNFVGLRSVKGIAEQRFNPANWTHNSLHPNERGHAAMLRVFQNWLADQGGLDGLDAVAPGTTVRTRVPEPVAIAAGAKCAQRTIEDNPCRTEGKTWVQQQVGLLVLTRGALALLAAGAAWMAAVAFFAWRLRRNFPS